MAYEFHIERVDPEGEHLAISLEEWQGAIAGVEAVRPASGDAVARNPTSEETIRIAGQPGDAEVFYPEKGWRRILGSKGRWIRVFRWANGRITFRPGDIDDPSDPVRRTTAQLCRLLGARVFGDEGEEYRWT